MSNLGSANAAGFWQQKFRKQDQARQDRLTKLSPNQQAFNKGTMNMLDEARSVVENAVGQGQELSPLIYQMLGLNPEYTDNSGQLKDSQAAVEKAQQQLDDANKTVDVLKAIPAGKRSPEQRRQLAQLRGAQKVATEGGGAPGSIAGLEKALGDAKDTYGRLQTMPKTITGLSRLDPSQIPPESPFSSANPLNQAETSNEQRLLAYQKGSTPDAVGTDAAAVDPTLVHKYAAAESALRAKLAQRFGPDFEATSVGQMALQTLTRERNESFATWNQQQVEKYTELAFQGQANLQNLLGQRIGLMQEPSQNATNEGVTLANTAAGRLTQQQTQNAYQLGRAGLQASPVMPSPIAGMAAGGLGSLLTTAGPAIAKGAASLYNTASGGLQSLVGNNPSGVSWGNVGTANDALAVDAGGAAAGADATALGAGA